MVKITVTFPSRVDALGICQMGQAEGGLQNKGGAGYILAWSFWLIPDSGDVKVLADGKSPNDTWVSAEPTQVMVSKLHEGLVCQYYLAPPSPDHPSAYFAVCGE